MHIPPSQYGSDARGAPPAGLLSNWRALRRTACLFVVFFVLLAGGGERTRAQSNDDEYQVKAAFLYHFAQLVEWPADTPTGTGHSLLLCTLGEDPFAGALEVTIAGKTVGRRILRVRHLEQAEHMQDCQILFLGRAQSKRIPMLLADLKNAPVLTVGETEGFLDAGGMVCFLLVDNKIRFAINLYAAEASRLKIGSQLLALAHSVLGERREK